MTDGHKDLQAAEYVLGTLSPESRLDIDQALERDRELQGLVAKWEQHFGSLLESGESVANLVPVNVPATPENAKRLRSRLAFLDDRILSLYEEDLKA